MVRGYIVVALVAVLAGCDAADAERSADAQRIDTVDPAELTRSSTEEPQAPAAEIVAAAGPGGAVAEEVVPSVAANDLEADDAAPSASSGGAPAPQSSQALANTPQTPAAGGLQPNEILERAEEAYAAVRSMEADFVQQVYVPLLDDTLDSRGKLYHRAPDRFLMSFTEPSGDIILADGRYAWMYYPSNDARQVMRAPLAEGGQQVDLQREFLSDATSRYSANRTGAETVGGRQTHALTLDPLGQSPYQEIRLWVDAENYLVRRFQITEVNETVRTIELSNLRPNVTLADDLFQFTPPAGAQVIEP
jgi:outer membrane lipoprotein carrier protein